ncbi:MAG: hypothetical protein JWP91_766 [Fibrobacteres bacterium]|nr:hypothetical protein [Fibrobacterota bacterium]
MAMRFSIPDSLYLTSAMRFSKAWSRFRFSLAALMPACFLLLACSPEPERVNFAYLRSPSFFRADTTVSDHSFCHTNTDPAALEDCVKAKKYRLSWVRPEDTTGLIGYRIYLDTADPAAPTKDAWTYTRTHPELASVIVLSHGTKDSLIFTFGSKGFKQDTLYMGSGKIFVLDSNRREDEVTGNLDFGLVPVYKGDATPGQPQFATFQTKDKFFPDVFHPEFIPRDTSIEIAWERPTDRVSFFNPSQDTGLILGYSLEVQLAGRILERRKTYHPRVSSYRIGDREMATATSDSLDNDTLPEKIFFWLPHSNRSAKQTKPV